MPNSKYLNLGCGTRCHPSWTNVDIASRGADVIKHDLSKGIPFPNCSYDVVYHSAVLEHLRLYDIPPFLRECYRVLKPGGIIRVGVPDLERLCRLYLEKLQAACDGDEGAARDHAWLMLEMYDQCVREKSGGEMGSYLCLDPLPNETFIYERIGEEGRQLIKTLRRRYSSKDLPRKENHWSGISIFSRLRGIIAATRKLVMRMFIGADGMRALEIGRFRLSGEVHHWAFDRYSLAKLLKNAGFMNPIVQGADESQIADFASFALDTTQDGEFVKPDLFFMEAVK